ncbi:hypothetical protein J3459_010910 [Metarhizium acridum]|nr:hypothetical protein J3459_010910 [Metarhizium acridum]
MNIAPILPRSDQHHFMPPSCRPRGSTVRRTRHFSEQKAPRRRSARRLKGEDGIDAEVNESRAKYTDGLSSKENVERAMHNLWEMENKLLNEAKRQRLAIEASNLEALAAKEDEAYGSQDVTKASIKYMDAVTTSTGTTRQTKSDNDINSVEETDSLENEVGERGAKRPPPVNSDQLPLPWTGRLGYVSIPSGRR